MTKTNRCDTAGYRFFVQEAILDDVMPLEMSWRWFPSSLDSLGFCCNTVSDQFLRNHFIILICIHAIKTIFLGLLVLNLDCSFKEEIFTF